MKKLILPLLILLNATQLKSISTNSKNNIIASVGAVAGFGAAFMSIAIKILATQNEELKKAVENDINNSQCETNNDLKMFFNLLRYSTNFRNTVAKLFIPSVISSICAFKLTKHLLTK